MSNQKENILYAQLERKGEKLEFLDPIKKKLYSELIEHMEEGQVADLFLDVNVDDGTLAQLAKVHKLCRIVAADTGHTFEEIKFETKRKAGLCITKTIEGHDYMICKSFGKCSKEELSAVIQVVIEIGRISGIALD